MAARVLLISCAATSATRRGAFPTDEPITARADVSPLRAALSRSRRWTRHTAPGAAVATGPELRCRETAEALELTPRPEPALADWHPGAWAGRTLDELLADDPAAVQHWLADPAFAPPGGEALTALITRVAAWLDTEPPAAAGEPAPRVVICAPGVARAALTHALQAPPATFWRLDLEPLSRVELTGGPGRWSLRL